MYATLVRTEFVTGNIVTFWFEPERRLRYDAGQYLDIHVPHANPDNRGTVRTMSLSSSPTEPLLGITTKREPVHSTFKKALHALRPGDQVIMHDAMGDFVLPKDPRIPIVFVAGSVGITPVRSMVQWLHDKGQPRDAQLIYIAQDPANMPYVPLFRQQPGLKLEQIYTQQAPAGYTAQARPNTQELLARIGYTQGKLIYLSGPKPMMEGFWYDLQRHGVAREQLVLDYFTGYNQL